MRAHHALRGPTPATLATCRTPSDSTHSFAGATKRSTLLAEEGHHVAREPLRLVEIEEVPCSFVLHDPRVGQRAGEGALLREADGVVLAAGEDEHGHRQA